MRIFAEHPGEAGLQTRRCHPISNEWLQSLFSKLFTVALIVLLPTGCNSGNAPVSRELYQAPLVPDVSINEIMVGQIDHSAHEVLRLNVNSRMTLGGWQELEHNAIQLVSGASVLTVGGTGINDAAWVMQPGWHDLALQFGTASSLILAATRSQDLPALLSAADALRDSCDNCHLQYKPAEPTEGFYRTH